MLELFVNVRKEQPLFMLTPENLNPEEYVKIRSKLSENKIIKLQFTAECTLNQPEEFLINLIQKEFKAYILSINNLDIIISNQLVPELNLPKAIRRINSKIFKAEQFPVSINPIKNELTPIKNRKSVSRKEKNRSPRKERDPKPSPRKDGYRAPRKEGTSNRAPRKDGYRGRREKSSRPPRRDGYRGPRREETSNRAPTRRRDGKPLQRRNGTPNRAPGKDGYRGRREGNRPPFKKEGKRTTRKEGNKTQ